MYHRIRAWLTVAAFGILFFVINGKFSIDGAARLLPPLGGEAAFFWDIMTCISPTVLGTRLPVIAWFFVLIISLHETHIIRTMAFGRKMPNGMEIALFVGFACYDVGTTYAGLTATWFANLAQWQWLVAGFFTLIITFGMEVLLSYESRRTSNAHRQPPRGRGDARGAVGQVARMAPAARPRMDEDLF